MWYKETDYPQIPTDHRSLTVAFANLLQKMEPIDRDPAALHAAFTAEEPVVDWWSASDYSEDIAVKEISDTNDWPPTSNAIIKFHRLDEATAGIVDHYCVIVDHRMHSIADSMDGMIKSASVYGEPVGWASYELIVDEAQDAIIPTEPSTPDKLYTVLRNNQTPWDIARQLNIEGMNGKDLAEHNDISETDKIPAGTVLHLPIAIPLQPAEKGITFKLFDTPQVMHVAKQNGARKQAFGHAKTFKDISPSGPTFAYGTPLRIVGLAEVPLLDGDEEVTAAYFMDELSLGDYRTTGRIRLATGFNHSHLAEGRAEAVQPAPKPQMDEQLKQVEKALGEAQNVPEEQPAPEPPAWLATIQPIYPDHHSETYLATEDMIIVELQNRRPSKALGRWQGVKICCTLDKDDQVYGLPATHVLTGFHFGVPMSKMTLEDELYNYDVPLVDRVASHGHLSPNERYVTVPLSKVLSQYTRFTAFIGSKNKKKEQ